MAIDLEASVKSLDLADRDSAAGVNLLSGRQADPCQSV